MYVANNTPTPPQPYVDRAQDIKNFCKTTEAKNLAVRKFQDRRIEVYPNIFADDAKFAKFQERVVDFELKNGKKGDDGLYEGPYAGPELQKSFAQAGTTILPLSYVATADRDESKDRNVGYVNAIRSLMRVVCKKKPDEYGRISKQSSIGFPYASSDIGLKKSLLARALVNLDDISDLVMKGNLEELYLKYDMLFLSNTQIRRQVDTYNRRREIEFFESTQKIPISTIDSRPPSVGRELMRTRVVYAYSWLPNIIGTVFGECIRRYTDSFEKVWKHRGPEEVKNKIQNLFDKNKGEDYVVKGIDYSRYDTSIPMYALAAYIECMPVPEPIREMMRLLVYAPHFVSDDGRGYSMLDGDPLKTTEFVKYRGLTSGVWFTSHAGKVLNVAYILYCLCEIGVLKVDRDGLIAEKDVISILEHRHISGIGILNQSDDMILGGPRRIVDKIFGIIKRDGIYSISEEESISFLGWLYYREENKIKYQLSLCSFLVGELVPERSITDKIFRPLGVWGLRARRDADIYGTNVQLPEMIDHIEKSFRDVYGFDRQMYLNAYERRPMFEPLDYIGYDIARDPSRIFWKYDRNELKQYEKFVNNYDYSLTEDFMKPLINKSSILKEYYG